MSFKYSPDAESTNAASSRFGYTGQAWLAQPGVYYYKSRVYSAKLGRFLQPDAIGYAGGMNLYAYVGGDPINLVDPFGFERCPPSTPDHAVRCARRFDFREWFDTFMRDLYFLDLIEAEREGAEPQTQQRKLCDALKDIAANASSNPFLNGTSFDRNQLGQEEVPPGGGPIDSSHFVEPLNGLAYDVQWIQVGWSLTKTYGRNIPQQFGVGYITLGAGPSAVKNWDFSFFQNGNIGADMRGLQFGEFGAGNFKTFESFVKNACALPR